MGEGPRSRRMKGREGCSLPLLRIGVLCWGIGPKGRHAQGMAGLPPRPGARRLRPDLWGLAAERLEGGEGAEEGERVHFCTTPKRPCARGASRGSAALHPPKCPRSLSRGREPLLCSLNAVLPKRRDPGCKGAAFFVFSNAATRGSSRRDRPFEMGGYGRALFAPTRLEGQAAAK